MIAGAVVEAVRDAWRGKPGARAALFRHSAACAPALVWIMGVCEMPLWVYLACFVYPGSEFGDGPLVRRAPRGARTGEADRDRRERAHLGPSFLYNNLHLAHHLRGGLPWYQIPTFYRLNRTALIERNGGLVYRSYFDVARRYLLTPHDESVHPDWRGRPA